MQPNLLKIAAMFPLVAISASARAVDRIYTLVPYVFEDSRFGFSGTITTNGSTGSFSDVSFIKDWSINIRTPSDVDGIATEVFTRSSGPPLVLFGPVFASESSLELLTPPPSSLALGEALVDPTSVVWRSGRKGGGCIYCGNSPAYVQIWDLGESPESAQLYFGPFNSNVLSLFPFAGSGVAIPEPATLLLFASAIAAIIAARRDFVRRGSRSRQVIAAATLSLVPLPAASQAADRLYTLAPDTPFSDSPFGISGTIRTDGSTGAISDISFIKDWSITVRTPSDVDGVASEVFTRASGPPLLLAFGPIFANEFSLVLRASGPSRLVLGDPQLDPTSVVWKSPIAAEGGVFGGRDFSAYVQITDLGESPETAQRNLGVPLGLLSNFPFAGNGVAVPEPGALVLLASAIAAVAAGRRRCARRQRSRQIIAGGVLALTASSAHADIYQWEYINPADPSRGKRQGTTLAPSGAGIDPAPGASLAGRNLTMAYLIGKDLTAANSNNATLTNADLSQSNLAYATFEGATLTNADLAGTEIRGAQFNMTRFGPYRIGTSLTLTQLYSTSSYQDRDLSGVGLVGSNLAGGNFEGLNLSGAGLFYDRVFADLTNANLSSANITNVFSTPALTGADLTAADARGAFFFNAPDATTDNLIWPDGHIRGLGLGRRNRLLLRDYDGGARFGSIGPISITVDQHLAMAPSSALRMVFEADAWDSTISFAPGIPVTLGGTLELTFAADVNPATQLGRTFDLFDWTGVAPVGAFAVSTPYEWDLSNLYITGEVTLTAVPEPTSFVPLLLGVLLIVETRRARFPLAIIVLVVCISPAIAQLPMTGTYVPELQSVDALLQNFMAGKPIPGGTVTITHNDKVIYDRGIGYSNLARMVPMQETALLRLASVSKPITASAIQQLAKDGLLDLNTKVFNIDGNGGALNITPCNGTLGDSRLRDITVRHLLDHQGGWNRQVVQDLAFRDVQIANTLGVPSPPGIANTARYVLSQPLQFSPGTSYGYANIGYMFLGMVVEQASGQAYESYVDNHVLAPAGIPAWEVDAGRTFAADQNPREPVYSDASTTQNVFIPSGPPVPWPYGGWDNERAHAFGGLIASSKAIALLAQNRIAAGPDIGKLRSDYAYPDYAWYHYGSLPGTDTLIAQRTLQDSTYSILFDRRPTDGSSYSDTLSYSLESALDELSDWPAPLLYPGDFTDDQWLTLDDVTLFKQAVALDSEATFATAYPTARYAAGDFDGNGQVNLFDSAPFIAALEHAGTPAEYIALVPSLPGDFNDDGTVDGADLLAWQRGESPNPLSPDNLSLWQTAFGAGAGVISLQNSVPEPMSGVPAALFALAQIKSCAVSAHRKRRRRSSTDT